MRVMVMVIVKVMAMAMVTMMVMATVIDRAQRSYLSFTTMNRRSYC